ncbi:hypothetical protein RZQ20_29770, partial [Raoultella ornithinolytica]|uniref:hypothetical protein n=1 Tax=Raoultella ornithinolytica TaxID=54291 RepID=UPI00292AB9AC
KHMITGGDLRQSRLDVGYKTFTISPWAQPPTHWNWIFNFQGLLRQTSVFKVIDLAPGTLNLFR